MDAILKRLNGRLGVKMDVIAATIEILNEKVTPLDWITIAYGDLVVDPCFVMQYLVSFLFCNHLAEEKRYGCFTLIAMA